MPGNGRLSPTSPNRAASPGSAGAAGSREPGQRLQVVAVVDQLKVGVGGRPEPQQVGLVQHPGRPQQRQARIQPAGLEGVARPKS